jgi:hypothetical protein
LRGTQVAALFYTLCESAKLAGLDPYSYVLRALYAAIAQPGTVTFPEDPGVLRPSCVMRDASDCAEVTSLA